MKKKFSRGTGLAYAERMWASVMAIMWSVDCTTLVLVLTLLSEGDPGSGIPELSMSISWEQID